MSRKRISSTCDYKEDNSDARTDQRNLMKLKEEIRKNQDENQDMEDVEHSELETSFLDTFYGLSSEYSIDRSQAAEILLNHCLVGSNTNLEDAAYTLRRLMNGLCSGRKAVRQGHASALTSFLRLSHQLGLLEELSAEEGGDSAPSFVRKQLIKCAKSKAGDTYGKNGSEERDDQFGLLFGILSIIRSGILFHKRNKYSIDQMKEVPSSLVGDLLNLYNHCEWMREPASYAMIQLIDFFYDLSSQSEAQQIVEHLVSDIIVPGMLYPVALKDYTAEQLALALNIQAQSKKHSISLPGKLKTTLLCKKTIPLLAKALSSTSKSTKASGHIVWDILFCTFLTTPAEFDGKQTKRKIQTRMLIKELPQSADKTPDVVRLLVQHIIVDSLLGVEQDCRKSSSTHERQILALLLVQTLCGGECASPRVGPYRIRIDGSLLSDCILNPGIVKNLFLDIISDSGGGPKAVSHSVLESIVSSCDFFADNFGRRFAVGKAFLSCNPRFDSRTKSLSCIDLLCLENTESFTFDLLQMWEDYVDFFIEQTLSSPSINHKISDGSAFYNTIGYVDLTFKVAKKILRLTQSINHDFILKINKKILYFFFVGAFFDCSKMKSEGSDLIEIAVKFQKGLNGIYLFFPSSVRVVMAARFYSLLADYATALPKNRSALTVAERNVTNDSWFLELLIGLMQDLKKLETHGCKRLAGKNAIEDREKILEIISKQQQAAINYNDTRPSSLHRFKTACATLNSVLYLHLLRCGYADNMEESAALRIDEEDDQEIVDYILDLGAAQHGLMTELGHLENDGDNKGKLENALNIFVRVCGGILSSQFNDYGESRGASPTLLREVVKTVWSSTLSICVESKSRVVQFDNSLKMILLELIGIDEMKPCSEDDETFSGSLEDDSDINENDDDVFAMVAASGLDIEDSNESLKEANELESDIINKKEYEVNLDSNELQTMLMEDVDVDDDDEDELEHHEGADAALAHLIKLKQNARKAGQQARERAALSNQMRCILLFEIIFRQVDSRLLTSEFLTGIFLPILRRRRSLEKAVKKESLGQDVIHEKRAMMEKLTLLMKTKLKIKEFPELNMQIFSKLVSDVINEIQIAETDAHLQCSSLLLNILCRMSHSKNSIICLSNAFSTLVNDWATKRTFPKVSVFDYLVKQQPSIAKIILVPSLCKASKDARNNFLKSECFRLLNVLVSISKPNTEVDTSIVTEMGDKAVRDSYNDFAKSLLEAIKNDEMRKGKRIRALLKTINKFVDYVVEKAGEEYSLIHAMETLKVEIISLKGSSESSGVASICDALTLKLSEFIALSQSRVTQKREEPKNHQSKKKRKKKKH